MLDGNTLRSIATSSSTMAWWDGKLLRKYLTIFRFDRRSFHDLASLVQTRAEMEDGLLKVHIRLVKEFASVSFL